MKNKINWGILGTANIARKALIPGIIGSENSTLYAIAGRKKEKVEEFAKLFKPEKTYDSYDEILADDKIDALYIPLPNALHKEWVIKALNKKKNVLCEKPIGLNETEVTDMFEVAEKNDVFLMEAFAYIHNPLIKRMKKIVDDGDLGAVKSMNSTFSFDLTKRPNDIRWSSNLGGGAMYDLGCYTLHLSRHIMDKTPDSVKACSSKTPNGVDESTTAILNFSDKTFSQFHVSFIQAFSMVFEINGTRGKLRAPFTFNESGDLDYFLSEGGEWERYTVSSPDNYMLEATHFSDVVLGNEKPVISKEDSFDNARMIRLILENSGVQ